LFLQTTVIKIVLAFLLWLQAVKFFHIPVAKVKTLNK